MAQSTAFIELVDHAHRYLAQSVSDRISADTDTALNDSLSILDKVPVLGHFERQCVHQMGAANLDMQKPASAGEVSKHDQGVNPAWPSGHPGG